MIFRQESDPKKIKEFVDMVDNLKLEMRRYKYPVLVWAVKEGTVYYTIWEKEVLEKFGLESVDGWDFEEDALFCPDWIEESEDDWDEEEEEDDLDEDFDLKDFEDLKDCEKD